jgi:hypothetical protein
MEAIQFWLHRWLKRLSQYIGVMVAAIPAGIIYLLLSSIIVPQIAFVISLPVALSMAYLAWRWLDRSIRFPEDLSIGLLEEDSPTQTMLLSEAVLRKDWDSPEDNEVWANF